MSVSLIDGHIDDDVQDNEIIKALENIINEKIGCCAEDCAFYDGKVHSCAQTIAKHSLDLINCQKAEIERLKNECFCLANERDAYKDVLDTAVVEALKEFAEGLKKEAWSGYIMTGDSMCPANCLVTDADIDKMLKKWVGDKDES